MTDDKLYTSLSANTIMAKLTNQFQRTTYNIIAWQTLFTWLWRWLPLRLSKRQSPTTVLFRTTFTRTITLYELLILLGLNHLQYHHNNKVLSFVSLCSHLGCMSRRFDCILLFFIRRCGRLVTRNHINHFALLWLVGFQQLRLVHFNPRCSGELFSSGPLFSQLSCCCVSWSWAPMLLEFQFYYPCWCCEGEVLCESPLWPCVCTNADHDQ